MAMQDACPSRPRRRLLAVGALAPLLALGGGTGAAALECDTTGARRDMISAAAVEALKATGDFAIIEGNATFHSNISNPVGQYGTVRFPLLAYPPAFCNSSLDGTHHSPICTFTLPMGPRDAIVWLGCTPTHLKYWSVRSHTEFRFTPKVWNVAAELGDPINHLTFNSTKRRPDDVFGKTGLVVSTADGETFRRIADAVVEAGLPDRAVNLDIIASDLSRLRHKPTPWFKDLADGVSLIFRASAFESFDKAQSYLQHKWPVLLLRAKGPYAMEEGEPLQRAPLRPRGTGNSQRDTHREALDELEEKVKGVMMADGKTTLHARYTMQHFVPDLDLCRTDPNYSPITLNSSLPHNNNNNPQCGHFTRDALYTLMPNETPLDDMTFPPNRTYVVLGVNQPLLGRCVYSNLFIGGAFHEQAVGHTANFTGDELAGSALPYAPQIPMVKDLFVVRVARSCPPKTSGFLCQVLDTNAIMPVTEPVLFGQRAYLEPATQIGPAEEEILEPRVLVFETAGAADVGGPQRLDAGWANEGTVAYARA